MIYSQEYGEKSERVEFQAYERNGGVWGAGYLWSWGMSGGCTPVEGVFQKHEDALAAAAREFLAGRHPVMDSDEYRGLKEYAEEAAAPQLDLFGGL